MPADFIVVGVYANDQKKWHIIGDQIAPGAGLGGGVGDPKYVHPQAAPVGMLVCQKADAMALSKQGADFIANAALADLLAFSLDNGVARRGHFDEATANA